MVVPRHLIIDLDYRKSELHCSSNIMTFAYKKLRIEPIIHDMFIPVYSFVTIHCAPAVGTGSTSPLSGVSSGTG